ncbi:unnamed protein product [Musa acuminata var. zebrina]
MAMFVPASTKRKDLEVVNDCQPDLSLFSETKRIKISLDGKPPLILEEEVAMSSPAFEAQLQVDGLPQGVLPSVRSSISDSCLCFHLRPTPVLTWSSFLTENRNLVMTLPVDEMAIDGEVATATIASSLDPIENHEREETGAEEPMEVEEQEGLLQRPGRTDPVIWSGCKERTWFLRP